MRSAAHIKSHPIHPMLIPFPFAYLVGSACIGAYASASGRSDWLRTARHLKALGIGAALVAAIPGIVDYLFTVPPESSARKRATDHMLANLASLAVFGLTSLDGRRNGRRSWWSVGADLAAAGMMSVGGWLGGTLVTRNQISVDHRYANAGRWRELAARPTDNGWFDAAATDELREGQMKLLHAAGKRIALARTEKGYAAISDRCTHKGGALSDGTLSCGIVQCPWHGSQFDVATGAVKEGPAEESVETYEVQERNGRVLVRL